MPEPSSICMNLLVRYPYEDGGFKPEQAKLRDSVIFGRGLGGEDDLL